MSTMFCVCAHLATIINKENDGLTRFTFGEHLNDIVNNLLF
jgi:hypothetical protein